MPANVAFRCQYAMQFIAVLRRYGLPVDAPSAAVLRNAAETCHGDQFLKDQPSPIRKVFLIKESTKHSRSALTATQVSSAARHLAHVWPILADQFEYRGAKTRRPR